MHVAIPLDNWLEKNALYCNRYHARLTPATCAANREKFGEERCAGCGGLEDQVREPERRSPIVIYSEPEPEEIPGVDPEVDDDEFGQDYFPAEIEETTIQEKGLNDFQRELLAQLEDDWEEDEPERRPEPKKKLKRRYAVYLGRCPRCSGYMVNIPEFHDSIRDDDVYRCFTCGHRTSPTYEWNRLQLTAGRKG